MVSKQFIQGLYAPDGSQYVTLTDGAGNLSSVSTSNAITAVFSGADTASATATLAGVAGKTTFLSGFSVSGLGSTAGGPVTVTTTGLTNNLSYTYVFAASATTANTPILFQFSPALPASAVNTAIVITVPGQAGNTATQINVWGYQL